MISYAQNQEDVFLWRCFKSQPTGFYVDVGAAGAIELSVTKWFYDQGWSGINIEPSQEYFEELQSLRPRDTNFQLCISNRSGEGVLNKLEGFGGLASLKQIQVTGPAYINAQRTTQPVQITTLKQLLEKASVSEIDFMKIDVEGLEQEAIEGCDFERFRPKVLLVEATRPMTSIPSHETWEPTLIGHRYLFAYFDGLNRFYVREESKELMVHFKTPPNYFDDFELYSVVELRQRIDATERRWSEKYDELNREFELVKKDLDRASYRALERVRKIVGQSQILNQGVKRVLHLADSFQRRRD